MWMLVLPRVLFLLGLASCTTSLNSGFPCPDPERVCSSTLRVGSHNGVGGSIIDEGPYCTCETCPTGWDEVGDQTLTWYHHEKSDWLVQYKFCEPIIPRRTCADQDVVAAVVEADSNGWNPRLKSMQCRCPKGLYHMRGWIRESPQHWDYHYTCERPLCTEKNPCVKHYLKHNLKKTTGFRFLCTCPEGHICPTKHEEDEIEKADGEDGEGPFINGYCKKIQSHLKKEYTDRLANKINKS